MDEIYLVVREESHIDTKYIPLFDQVDAIRTAQGIITYWNNRYDVRGDTHDIYTDIPECVKHKILLRHIVDPFFSVEVHKLEIQRYMDPETYAKSLK